MGKGMHLFTQGPRVRLNPNLTLARAYRVWLSSTLLLFKSPYKRKLKLRFASPIDIY